MTNANPVRRPTYRLYIDEVGHATIKSAPNDEERYLGLIGVCCNIEYIHTTLQPEMENLKRFFVRSASTESHWRDPDEQSKPIVFHRKELASKTYPFEALKDPVVRETFDNELLECLTNWEYTVFIVVIDKEELKQKYVNPAHPYHYGMEILLERYVKWLGQMSAIGDVMAEARGGKEDRLLKEHYQKLYFAGTGYVSSTEISEALSSRELKLKQKTDNIAGLQLAEFLIRPCYYAALALKHNQPLPTNFGGKIEAIVQASKYYRSGERIDGYGRKWLP